MRLNHAPQNATAESTPTAISPTNLSPNSFYCDREGFGLSWAVRTCCIGD
ncbi:hypothetical protein NIES39_R01170 [Arthrospira platensis NIES-39]|nr:hypothetical protein NIES39_R01170 [Arthrospira platensis NIES-39]